MRPFLLISLVGLIGCSQAYLPNVRNAPQFREAGEFQLGAYVGTGLDVQTAYAVTDHFLVTANASYLSQKEDGFTRKNRFGELGIGYYNAKRFSDFDLIAGYGMGQSTHSAQYYFFFPFFGQQQITATGNYQRFFVQPSFGTNARNFNVTFTTRLSMVDFPSFTSSDRSVRPDERALFFLEPALTGRFPISGALHGMVQLGVTTGFTSEGYFRHSPLQAAFGVQINTTSLRTRVY